jgi:hypothetical protein
MKQAAAKHNDDCRDKHSRNAETAEATDCGPRSLIHT